MKIITSNPVVQSGDEKSPSDMYYNFNLGQFNQVQQGFTQSQEQKGLTWDKIKGAWVKAKESGLVDKGVDLVKGLINKGKGGSTGGSPKSQPPVSTKPKTKPKGMSTTTIVLIGVGVAVVLGIAIYSYNKGK